MFLQDGKEKIKVFTSDEAKDIVVQRLQDELEYSRKFPYTLAYREGLLKATTIILNEFEKG